MNTEITYYFDHPYNNTLQNERAVEVILGLRYIDLTKGDLVEIGAVTPYYISSKHESLDPSDEMATTKEYAENYDYSNKNVLSISTIEHIGRGELGPEDAQNEILAFDVLNKIYKESKSCLITWPIGYNKFLDDITKKNLDNFNYFFYVKREMAAEPPHVPVWELVNNEEGFNFHYGSPFICANSIIVITKGILAEG